MIAKKNISALILCAGKSSRSGLLYNKIFYYLGKKTVLETTLDSFHNSVVDQIILVISPFDEQRIREIVSNKYNVKICYGGKTRTESVKNGLNFINECDIVVIHDCARPYANKELIEKCTLSAIKFGSGIAAIKSTDTLKKVIDNFIVSDINRENTYRIQTPQAFNYKKILNAYNTSSTSATDDSEIYLQAGHSPKIVEGSYDNIKITSNSDLYAISSENLKIGTGFDVHQIAGNKPLILGGKNIPHNKGLVGHSDADVLIHAIMDALLSAADLPDIGVIFPNTDIQYKNISSILLLNEVKKLLDAKDYGIRNISAVIIAQKPKLSPHIDSMKNNIAASLDISIFQINISATTTETLGLIGKEKGIAASCVCLLENYK